MSETRIVVQFEAEEPGFEPGRAYPVLVVQGGKFLLIDEEARFVWMDPARTTPVAVRIGSEVVFDLQPHRERRRLERLAGKAVRLTTWENLGFDPDEVNEESMLVYRGVVDHYDGETLFLRRPDGEEQFGVLPRAIATITEETA